MKKPPPRPHYLRNSMSCGPEHGLGLAARSSAPCHGASACCPSPPWGAPAKTVVTGDQPHSPPAQALALPCFPSPLVNGQCICGQERRLASSTHPLHQPSSRLLQESLQGPSTVVGQPHWRLSSCSCFLKSSGRMPETQGGRECLVTCVRVWGSMNYSGGYSLSQ